MASAASENDLIGANPPRRRQGTCARTASRTARRRARRAASSSAWVPRSTMRPSSSTRIWSAAWIVDSRWAITIDVRPASAVAERLLDQQPRSRSRGGGGLVEDHDGGVLEQHAGDGQALLLAARQPVAALADDGVVAVGQRGDDVVDARGPARGHDLVVGGVGLGVAQVGADVSWNRCGVLGDDADRGRAGSRG